MVLLEQGSTGRGAMAGQTGAVAREESTNQSRFGECPFREPRVSRHTEDAQEDQAQDLRYREYARRAMFTHIEIFFNLKWRHCHARHVNDRLREAVFDCSGSKSEHYAHLQPDLFEESLAEDQSR